MQYKYADKENFEYLSSGRILYSCAGLPNFPVRLGNEIFNRSLHYADKKTDITLYDPCCGGGYLLTTIGFLNYDKIKKIYASDINAKFLDVAAKNLKLLSKTGLTERKQEIIQYHRRYGKEVYKDILQDFDYLLNTVTDKNIQTVVFENDLFSPTSYHTGNITPDIIITDIPYGNLVKWENDGMESKTILNRIELLCKGNAIVVIISDEKQDFRNQTFKRLEKFKIGKRHIQILKKKMSINAQ